MRVRRVCGFTFEELLVVVAIITILAAIIYPVFAKARQNARQSGIMSHVQLVAVPVTAEEAKVRRVTSKDKPILLPVPAKGLPVTAEKVLTVESPGNSILNGDLIFAVLPPSPSDPQGSFLARVTTRTGKEVASRLILKSSDGSMKEERRGYFILIYDMVEKTDNFRVLARLCWPES